jgi:hypothetical protein
MWSFLTETFEKYPLWILGPVAAALAYVLTGWRDRRREAEIERWRVMMDERAGRAAGVKRVESLPGPLMRMVDAAGGGQPVAYFELVPKIAYLALMAADSMNGSDHHTVVGKLEDPAPMLTAHPLPIVEGERIPNTGVLFKKDPDMTELYLVERAIEGKPEAPASEGTDKAIRKWLSPPVRAALKDLPDVWLRADGKAMALSLYGPADAEKLSELITTADVVFAEYGADGGPSLFGDDEEDEAEEAVAPAPVPAKKDAPKKGAKGAGAKA